MEQIIKIDIYKKSKNVNFGINYLKIIILDMFKNEENQFKIDIR